MSRDGLLGVAIALAFGAAFWAADRMLHDRRRGG